MNKEQRVPYLALTEITLPSPRFFEQEGEESWGKWNIGLCFLCRYAEWQGRSLCDDGNYCECHCGIESLEEDSYDRAWGGDCWAFRPEYTLEDCVDAVGLLLNGWYPDWGSCRRAYKKRRKA